jgi:GTP cyclohydrolase II
LGVGAAIVEEERGQVAVERAIAEIRGGRPVVVLGDDRSVVVCAVDSLDEALAGWIESEGSGGARLLLSWPRLHHLGRRRSEAGAIALPTIDRARIEQLTVGVEATADADVLPLDATEFAALDLCRLALVLPACIVFPTRPDSARDHGLLEATAEQVRRFRAGNRRLLREISRAPAPLEGAPDSEFVIFRGGEGLRDQAAVIVGHPDFEQPVSVRLHSACLTGDLFGSLKCDCGDQLRATARYFAEHDGGVILYLDQEGRGNGLANKIRAYFLQTQGYDTYDADEALGFDHDQRGFAFAAEMLRQLGIARVRLFTNNPLKIAALEDAGLDVVSDHRIFGRRTAQNRAYLEAKRDRAGHLIEPEARHPPATRKDQ